MAALPSARGWLPRCQNVPAGAKTRAGGCDFPSSDESAFHVLRDIRGQMVPARAVRAPPQQHNIYSPTAMQRVKAGRAVDGQCCPCRHSACASQPARARTPPRLFCFWQSARPRDWQQIAPSRQPFAWAIGNITIRRPADQTCRPPRPALPWQSRECQAQSSVRRKKFFGLQTPSNYRRTSR